MEPDKEFDRLFQSKLNGLEADPSVGVWRGIENELDTNKGKMKIVSFLGIAASLLILLSAGLLFIPHQIKISGKHLVQNKTAKSNRDLNATQVTKNMEKHVPAHKPVETISQQIIAVDKVKRKRSAIAETDKVKPIEASSADLTIAATSQPNKQDIINPVVIVKETAMPVEQPAHESIDVKPVLAAVVVPAADQPVAEIVKPKRKIKSFGDLVNVVVAKVDKRKDKLIEFTDVDDDESTITGINLGILKIKKEK